MKKNRRNRKNKNAIILGGITAAIIVIGIVFAVLSGRMTINPSIDRLPDDYSLEDAKKDGCVIYDVKNFSQSNSTMEISHGQKKWDSFIKSTQFKIPCAVRLVLNEGNEKLTIYDLSYDGKDYELKFVKYGKLVSETYRYLLKSDEVPPIPSISTLEKRVIYFLADDPDLTWTAAVQSSQKEEVEGTKAYRYFRVYSKSFYKSIEN